MTARQHKKIYLDQMAVSHMAGSVGTALSDTKYGRVVEKAQREGTGEVWVSPVHVIETYLCVDLDETGQAIETDKQVLRQHIASQLCSVIGKERMLPSRDFVFVREMLDLLRGTDSDSAMSEDQLNQRQAEDQEVYLKILHELASNLPPKLNAEALQDILRAKLSTKLKLVQIAADPRTVIERMASGQRNSEAHWWADHDGMTVGRSRDEISRLESELRKADSGTIAAMQRGKKEFIEARARDELEHALRTVFDTRDTLSAAFNISVVGSLSQGPGRTADVWSLVADLAFAGANQHTLSCMMAQDAAWSELESMLKHGKLKRGRTHSEGTTFDADHLAYLPSVDAFVTQDDLLLSTAKKHATRLEREIGRKLAVLGSAEELERWLDKQ